MAVLMLPGMVACMGAVVVASENSNPEAIFTLQTEAGEECLLRISEKAAKQIAKVISEFNRSRDFLFAEEQAVASASNRGRARCSPKIAHSRSSAPTALTKSWRGLRTCSLVLPKDRIGHRRGAQVLERSLGGKAQPQAK